MTGLATRTDRRTGEQGFTLIEMIIVLLIVLSLVGMLAMSTRGNDQRARQQAMSTVANEVFTAAVAFNAEFPRIGANDPLINFSQRTTVRRSLSPAGTSMPTAESKEQDLGLFTKTGQPYFRATPASPYGGQLKLLRGATCPTTGQIGYTYICRAGAGVRVTAWGRGKDGKPLLVFDEVGGI